MQAEHPDLIFEELARRLGEMWRALQEEEKKEYGERAKHIQEERMMAWKEMMKSLPQNYESPQKKSKKKTSGGLKSGIPVGPRGGGGRGGKTGPAIAAVNSLDAQNQSFLLPKVKDLTYILTIALYCYSSEHPSPEQWPCTKFSFPTASP